MSVNQETLDLIKAFEGWHRRLEDGRAAPYLCPANVWTIGWGSIRGLDGNPVTRNTQPITEAQGEVLLARDLRHSEVAVTNSVRVPVTPNQYGALVSFVYNLGPGRLRSSTLLRKLNSGLYDEAADEFGKWIMAGGRPLPGLVRRREAEKALFLKREPEPQLPPAPSVAEQPQSSGWIRKFTEAFNRVREPAR